MVKTEGAFERDSDVLEWLSEQSPAGVLFFARRISLPHRILMAKMKGKRR